MTTRFALLLALTGASLVAAQAPTYQGAMVRAGDAELAARACVGELGWPTDARLERWRAGCAAITGVHARRAARRGWSLGRMTQAYSAPIRRRVGPRVWVRSLRDRAAPPAGGPSGSSWRRRRPLYRRALETVREVFEGELVDPCLEEAPLHHGSRADGGFGPAWVEVTCDRSPQVFWARRPGGDA